MNTIRVPHSSGRAPCYPRPPIASLAFDAAAVRRVQGSPAIPVVGGNGARRNMLPWPPSSSSSSSSLAGGADGTDAIARSTSPWPTAARAVWRGARQGPPTRLLRPRFSRSRARTWTATWQRPTVRLLTLSRSCLASPSTRVSHASRQRACPSRSAGLGVVGKQTDFVSPTAR
ncbi:hypothetical protein BD413DRAFT_41318 [Trametes elegans]|nr:hypothetical protein BD413DRAFT_41318 [Trametes elegans]